VRQVSESGGEGTGRHPSFDEVVEEATYVTGKTLLDHLEDPVLRAGMLEFANGVHAGELVLMWAQIVEFKEAAAEDRLQIGRRVAEEFLVESSINCVNVDGSMRQKLLDLVRPARSLEEDVFDDVQTELEVLMGSDLFMQYAMSKMHDSSQRESADEEGNLPLTLKEMLTDNDSFQQVLVFASSTMEQGNVLFWYLGQEFRRCSDEQRNAFGSDMMDRFFSRDSREGRVTCLSEDEVGSLRRKWVDLGRRLASVQFFDEVLEVVFAHMDMSLYPRYIESLRRRTEGTEGEEKAPKGRRFGYLIRKKFNPKRKGKRNPGGMSVSVGSSPSSVSHEPASADRESPEGEGSVSPQGSEDSSAYDSLIAVLHDPEELRALMIFAGKMMEQDAVLFWCGQYCYSPIPYLTPFLSHRTIVEEFTSVDQVKRVQLVQHIMERFVFLSGDRAISLEGRRRRGLIKNWEEIKGGVEVPMDMFDSARREVERQILQSLWPEYVKYRMGGTRKTKKLTWRGKAKKSGSRRDVN